MKLNFACGSTRWPGFESSDIVGDDIPHVDLEAFPYPYPDGSASLILISHAFQMTRDGLPVHPDPGRIVREFHRILQPEGWLRIDENPFRIYDEDETLDGGEAAKEARCGFPDDLRIRRADFCEMLADAGFDPIVELPAAETQIPGDDRDAILGNHLWHFSFALEAQA